MYKFFFFLLAMAITPIQHVNAQPEVQGHRGCRGLFPENSIPAFIKAVQLGVHTIEMDVVVTADSQILVSHEPYMSHEICSTPAGEQITTSSEKSYNIYRMTVDEVQQFDCGSKVHTRFPGQEKIKICKPLLQEVIDSVESYINQNKLSKVWYNIEIKSSKKSDDIFHPKPDVFVNLLIQVLDSSHIMDRVIVQSFDVRPLQIVKKLNFPVKVALLVDNIRGLRYNLEKLGFEPDIYSPYFKLISSGLVTTLHQRGIRIIPWTVNHEKDMKKMMLMGVDGIITDYPDRLIKLLNNESE